MSVTLGELEAEVASRCGPFEQHAAALGGTDRAVVLDGLRSTIPLGGYTDRWLLRRAAFGDFDRQRRVADYDPDTGTLVVDRPYTLPVGAGEQVELMVLDPAQELRPAVLRGLARCYFVERAGVEVTPGRLGEDLSAALFWITDVGQIRDVQQRTQTTAAVPLRWYRLLSYHGGPVLHPSPPGVAGTDEYVVEALRPHATWVNGADAPRGPAWDADVLACPLDYAAALGHAEAWHRCRATLQPIAQAGYAAPLAEATREVTRLVTAQWWYWDRGPDRLRVADPYPGAQGTGAGALVPTPAPTRSWRAVADGFTWNGLTPFTWRQVLQSGV